MSRLRHFSLCVVLALLAAYPVAVLAGSGPAEAAGTVTVTVQGKGTVTATGIDCSETAGPDCSEYYPDVLIDCDPQRKPPCMYENPSVVLTAAPDRDGFAFDHFEGCDSTSGRTCEVVVGGPVGVTAVFRDVTPPTVSLTQPTDGAILHGVETMQASASDNVAVVRVEFLVNYGPLASDTTAPYSATLSTNSVPDGRATIEARAYDSAGYIRSSTVSVVVDNTVPSLTLTGPDNQTFGPGSTQRWDFVAQDATSGVKFVQCSLRPSGQSSGFFDCSQGVYSVVGYPEGSYEFQVRVTDKAGNLVQATRHFAIDATAPETIVTAGPPNGATAASRSVSFGLGTDDTGATLGCRLYRSGTTAPAFAPCTTATSFSAGGLDDGSYVFQARAVDAVGNADATPATRAFTVDATAPTLQVVKQPKHKVRTRKKKATAVFAFASEPGATYRCTLDGKAIGCGPTLKVKVKAGKHVLTVSAVDVAGNSSQPAVVKWKVKRLRKHH